MRALIMALAVTTTMVAFPLHEDQTAGRGGSRACQPAAESGSRQPRATIAEVA